MYVIDGDGGAAFWTYSIFLIFAVTYPFLIFLFLIAPAFCHLFLL